MSAPMPGFARRRFALGVLLISVGVALHLPAYASSSDMHHEMVGMGFDPLMVAGTLAIVGGLAVAARAIVPAGALRRPQRPGHEESLEVREFGASHALLVTVVTLALVIDTMKPATIGFILPQLRAEYGIGKGLAGTLPLMALLGTTVGSVLWGRLADAVGRRPSLLLAALLFVSTAVCGTMPAFELNLLMCFLMGLSAGGMLPVALALLSEMIPRRLRGFVVVLAMGVGSTGGYLVAASAAAGLEPTFGWRALWLVGLPSGLALLAMQRIIPESPRFLRLQGRHREAREVMRRFGMSVVSSPQPPQVAQPARRAGIPAMTGSRLRGPTIALSLIAMSWGLVNFGFLTWLPSMLDDKGFDTHRTLLVAGFSALPGTLVLAWLYSTWSTKRSLVLACAVSAAALAAVAVLGSRSHGGVPLLLALTTLLLAINGLNSMLLPYSAEIYPTELRGTGTGFIAATGKLGGLIGVGLVSALIIIAPGPAVAALVLVGPLVASALGLALRGRETRGLELTERL